MISAILRQVRDGRRADMDSVELFLHRYASMIPQNTAAPAETKPAAKPKPPVKEVAKENKPKLKEKPKAVAATPSVRAPEPKPEPKAEPVIPKKAKVVRLEPKPQKVAQDAPAPVSEFAAALSQVTRSIEAQPDQFDAFEPEFETTAMPDLTPVPKPSPVEERETIPDPVVVSFSDSEDACTNALRHLNGCAEAIRKLIDEDEGDPAAALSLIHI